MPTAPSTAATSPPPAGAAASVDPIAERWVAIGGAGSILGTAVGPRGAVAGGQYQRYVNGIIWYSGATGAWETWGEHWRRFEAAGGPAGVLGFPVGPQGPVGPGFVQSFEGGRIWWAPGLGAWDTWGEHWRRFESLGGPLGILGFPMGGQAPVGAGFVQSFERGRIWWAPGLGAWDTWGEHWRRFEALGGPYGLMGFPVGGQQPVGSGFVQSFQRGRIWWAPGIGAVETWGEIDARFSAIGGPPSGLGFPLASHIGLATRGGTFQPFQGGTIHWSPGSGAYETLGDFHRQWAQAGWEHGWYGYPTSGTYLYLGGVRQDFQGGSLLVGVQPVLDATRSGVSAADVWATWRPGCPVGPESLTLLRLNHWGFDNAVHRGEIIVRSDLAGRVENAFAAALNARFPIRKMWRADYYGGSDPAAMADDNTSGFNCRQVTGGTGISPHSYGIAVDVNTVENPYYTGIWWPHAGYVDRGNARPGMLFAHSELTVAFRNNGFSWGGTYRDYQHFQYVG